MQGVVMHAFTLASCQIMPHDIVVVTGVVLIGRAAPLAICLIQPAIVRAFLWVN